MRKFQLLPAWLSTVVLAWTVGCSLSGESGPVGPGTEETAAVAEQEIAGTTQIKPSYAQGQCLEPAGGNTGNGGMEQIWNCTQSLQPNWSVVEVSSGVYEIHQAVSGKCITVWGNNFTNGTQLGLWACQGQSGSRWTYTQSGTDYVFHSLNNANKCIDVSGAGSGNGTKVDIWDCNGGTSQQFALVPPAAKSAGCGASSWPGNNTYSINVTFNNSTQSRTFILQNPNSYDTNHPYKLIIAYHWLGGTATQVALGQGATGSPFYGLLDLASNSTIFVAPQGINPPNGWADTGGPGDPHDGPINKASQGGQDIAFTKALVSWLEGNLCVDTNRVFAEGFSMGGAMSYADACAMGDVFRAVAVHSGGPMAGCVYGHNKPVAYFMTHGLQDQVCTYGAWPGYGVPELADFATVNGCTTPNPANLPTGLPSPTGALGTHGCVDFQGCQLGFPTRSCIFVGPHTPSSPDTGPSNWIPGETWNFLSQF